MTIDELRAVLHSPRPFYYWANKLDSNTIAGEIGNIHSGPLPLFLKHEGATYPMVSKMWSSTLPRQQLANGVFVWSSGNFIATPYWVGEYIEAEHRLMLAGHGRFISAEEVKILLAPIFEEYHRPITDPVFWPAVL